jgi:hypothetical protein
MTALRRDRGVELLGDIAYNYSPFVAALREVFPAARLIYFFRDGREFVRSACTDEAPDPTPVGWPDPGRTLTREERFIALGRLRPRDDDPLAQAWPGLPAFERNAWLWAETNRIILDALEAWPGEQVFRLRFESFAADPAGVYRALRRFLGIAGAEAGPLQELLRGPINERARKALPPVAEWPGELAARYSRYADPVMERLAYR